MALATSTLARIVIFATIFYATFKQVAPVEGAQLSRSEGLKHRIDNLFAIVKQASKQGTSYIGDLVSSVPLGKIAIASGALLGLFLLFLRLIIVLSPIFILGALARESSEGYLDIFRMIIEFYNQVIEALDKQQIPSGMFEHA